MNAEMQMLMAECRELSRLSGENTRAISRAIEACKHVPGDPRGERGEFTPYWATECRECGCLLHMAIGATIWRRP
jgi:hypothetical protein